MIGRLPCSVPFCRRSVAIRDLTLPEMDEVLCPKHWNPLPKTMRAVYRRRLRRLKALNLPFGPAEARLWRRLKGIAMELAMTGRTAPGNLK